MSEKQFNRLIGVMYAITAILVLIGGFYPDGSSILMLGLAFGIVSLSVDNYQLRKKIHKLEKQNKQES